MPRLSILSGKEIIKILEKIGYREIHQSGNHIRLVHPFKKSITVPNYRTISRGLLRKILRDAEISAEEFMDYLK